jgi:hypothetical protein
LRNFLRIAQGVDVIPLLNAIAGKPDLWDENTLRTRHPRTAHGEVSDIWVWFNDDSDSSKVIDDREVIPYRAWSELPQVRPLVLDLMRRVEGVRLGRVIITRLPPGKRITPHVDGGAPATYYTRYQVALQSEPGAVFRIGDEAVTFRTGEVWRIDNTLEHSVENNSAADRIVLIVDVRTA